MRRAGVSVAFGAALALVFRAEPAHAHGEDQAAVAMLVIGGGAVAATSYDVVAIARSERPSLGWASSQAVAATFLAGGLGVLATQNDELESGPGFLTAEGWLAALGGYGVGSIASARPRAGSMGGAIGLVAVSLHEMTLTSIGKPTAPSASIVQAALATPAILGGTIWAVDARSTADRPLGVTLAALGGLAFVHGVTASAIAHAGSSGPPEPSPSGATAALGILPSEGGGCRLALSGRW